jgi:transposase
MDNLIKLIYSERSELEIVLVTSSNAKECHRAQALLLIDEGTSVVEVAELLRVSRQTIYNWLARFEARRLLTIDRRLGDAPRSGRPATADEIIDELLDEILDTDPRVYGYRSTIWTADLFQQYLADYFEISVSRRSIHYSLERLRVIWKRPRYTLQRRAECWRQAKGA